jgi:hypothetical protein
MRNQIIIIELLDLFIANGLTLLVTTDEQPPSLSHL